MSNRYLPEYDVVVIGSGIAGMFTALSIDKDKKVLLISKDKVEISNTDLAQGGIAVTFNPNDFESHILDTLKTGSYYNDSRRLRIMVEEGAKTIDTLIKWGVNFDTDEDGNILFTKEGGHSLRRIIHFKDTTGHEIVRGLLKCIKESSNIKLWENAFVLDLIVENNQVYGVSVLENNKFFDIFCRNIVVATGGIGELYDNTTNARIATGDGIAFASRAGANIKDMEFVQFHPTSLNIPGHSHFLISEAVRGEGGILRNENSEPFMEKYHELKDLAPRSIVSRAIIEECNRQGNDKIYVDVTHLDSDYIKNRFPNIYNECLKSGIDITKSLIPVVPVQHYIMGGIETDDIGRTNIKGLYACGEVACTGVHGANRMASNSLLEAIVFAGRIAKNINSKSFDNTEIKLTNFISHNTIDIQSDSVKTASYFEETKKELQHIMSRNVFIFRKHDDLIESLHKVNELIESMPLNIVSKEGYELLNMLTVAKIVIESAINRKDSLGSHIIDGGK